MGIEGGIGGGTPRSTGSWDTRRSEKSDTKKDTSNGREDRAREARSEQERQETRQRAEEQVFRLQARLKALQPQTARPTAAPAPQPRAPAAARAPASGKWDHDVAGWQKYCEPFKANATRAIDAKVNGLDFAQASVTTTVQSALKNGTASAVNAGHWSTVPGRDEVPLFFRDFRGPKDELVQVYSYPRVSTPLPTDPTAREQTLRQAEWVSFDVSGKLAEAYASESFMRGNTGTASVLGLPTSGAEPFNPHRDWPDALLGRDPEVARALQQGQPVRFQGFENGLLVEVGGKVQAFTLDGRRLGTAYPGGAIDGVGDSGAVTGPKAGFVGVQGGHLVVDGEPFRHVGANVSQLLYENKDRVWDELSILKESGVKDVRVFLPNSALTPQQMGDRLQTLLDLADARGMKVTVSLNHFARQEFSTQTEPSMLGGHNNLWDSQDYGGAFQLAPGDPKYAEVLYDLDANGQIQTDAKGDPKVKVGHPVLNNAWLQGGYRENYKPLAESIVERFKDHKAVLAWEVANETKSYFDPPDFEATKAFYADMVSTLRAKDPNHLITAGLTNAREFVGPGPEEQKRFLSQFDFVSIHQYNNDHMDDIQRDIAAAKSLGKPVVLSEFGFFKDGGTHPADPRLSEVRAYMDRAYQEWGVDAVMPWAGGALGGERWYDERYQSEGGVAAYRALLRDANTALEDWNARN